MTTGTNGGVHDMQAWEREWRDTFRRQIEDVTKAVRDTAEANQQTTVMLARLTDTLNEHDRRIEALEGKPAKEKAEALSQFHAVTQGGGCLYMAIYGTVSIITLVVSALIALVPHLIWH